MFFGGQHSFIRGGFVEFHGVCPTMFGLKSSSKKNVFSLLKAGRFNLPFLVYFEHDFKICFLGILCVKY